MNKTSLEQVYQAHHKRGNRYGYLFCHGARIPYLKHWIGTGKQVLDLGCRDGMLTQHFSTDNQVIGADIDREALSRFEKRLNMATVWLDLNSDWPFEPHSFDVIVACELLEHIFLLEPFLERVAKSLRPNGLFIGSVPNAFRMRNRWRFLVGREIENDPTHVRQFSYHKLQTVLASRFTDIEIIPLRGKIAPFIPVSAFFPQKLNALFAQDLLWRSSLAKERVFPR